MASGGVSSGESARLLAAIIESDLTVSANSGSEDPVAVDRVIDALFVKAEALGELGRFGEAVMVWDELLVLPGGFSDTNRIWVLENKSADLDSDSAHAAIPAVTDDLLALFDRLEQPTDCAVAAACALARKANALDALGALQDALRVDREVLQRFGANGEVAKTVSLSLANQTVRLSRLDSPERVDELIQVSDQLRRLLEHEPKETLAPVAQNVIWHLRALGIVAPDDLTGVMSEIGLIAGTAAIAVLELTRRTLTRFLPQFGSRLPEPQGLSGVLDRVAPIEHRRRLLTQKQVLSRVLIDQIGSAEDPELRRLSATAQIYEATAFMSLGQFGEMMRSFPDSGGQETGTVQALHGLAENASTSTALTQRLGLVASLRRRADALSNGDAAVARVAFDDSLDTFAPKDTRSRSTRLIARFLQPSGNDKIVVPDHLPAPTRPGDSRRAAEG